MILIHTIWCVYVDAYFTTTITHVQVIALYNRSAME